MREFTCKPIEAMDIDKIELELNSRDDIPQLIKGLHYIFVTPSLRQEVFAILTDMFPPELDLDNGRPGMDMWSILVMGALRLSLNCDYDRLHNLVNNHRTIRQILGHGHVDDRKYYTLQNLKDNVVLFTLDMLDQVNQAIVKAGHALIKKSNKTAKPYWQIKRLNTRSRVAAILLWWRPMWSILRIRDYCLRPSGKSSNC